MRTRIAALFILAASSGLAQSPPLWRFWDARDGMPETYTQTFGVDAQGRLWASHGGAAAKISINDGYSIRSVPSPVYGAKLFAEKADAAFVVGRAILPAAGFRSAAAKIGSPTTFADSSSKKN